MESPNDNLNIRAFQTEGPMTFYLGFRGGTCAVLKADSGVADGMAVHGVIKSALAFVLVLLVEHVRERSGYDGQREAGDSREQNRRLVESLVQHIVEHRACVCKTLMNRSAGKSGGVL